MTTGLILLAGMLTLGGVVTVVAALVPRWLPRRLPRSVSELQSS